MKRRGYLRWVGFGVLLLVAVAYIYPFLIQLATAFKTDADATAHPLTPWPHEWSVAVFSTLAQQDFPRWALNSIFVSVTITVGRVVFNSMAGYALARLRFRGRGAVFGAVVAVLAVPSVVLLIPKFLVLNQFGMYDTYAAMIIPLLADASGVFIMKQFFESVPLSVEEAARIDGAGPLRTFWSVVLPMSKPALITMTILAFQGSWNELPHYIVSRQDPALNTLTTGVASLVSGELGQGNQFPLKLAAALLMTVPVAIVYFVFSKRFTRGTYEGVDK
ncbi:carbohydrate ABC transporter permease [Amycolatopsis sp. CA-161197]|uniref:carbohydrate ABC transporter permease n=1 Tax=unclassified Amycolatopsis TaxID=2618356 RepID=UPI003454F4A5